MDVREYRPTNITRIEYLRLKISLADLEKDSEALKLTGGWLLHFTE